MNARATLVEIEKRLASAGVDSPRLDARLLIAAASGQDTTLASIELDRYAADRLEKLVRRRAAREPLAYIVGRKEFWSLAFQVGAGVLVPRPETEALLEQLQSEFPDRLAPLEIVDLGTGSAALLVSALVMFQRARGVGIDISAAAIGWASRNAEYHGVSDRCEFIATDWAAAKIEHQADVILVNPPYIPTTELTTLPPEVARYEPSVALAGGLDGLDSFRTLAPLIAHMLKCEGEAYLEIGEGQANGVAAILAAGGLEVLRVAPDLAGIPRCVVCRLRKDSVN